MKTELPLTVGEVSVPVLPSMVMVGSKSSKEVLGPA